jgi:pimeloyl-ACP methyl ester carboxylesterase
MASSTMPSVAAVTDINGQSMEYKLSGTGKPTVVFESGLGAHISCWDKVVPAISKSATTLTYNRAGHGRSAKRQSTRDGSTIVGELHELLHHLNLQPPYLLVGHSLGGLYAQLFAEVYPEEVSGLLLVDSTHPKANTGAAAIANRPYVVRKIFNTMLVGATKQEFESADETGEEVLAHKVPPNLHTIVLSSDKATGLVGDDLRQKQSDLSQRFSALRWQQIKCGHFIQWEQPDVVIASIQELMKQASAPESSTSEGRHN